MFTGIVEEIGIVNSFIKKNSGASLTITCKTVLEESKPGDSIAIDGVCQTIVKMTESNFTVDVSNETLSVTAFDKQKSGSKVNLERALTLSTRLGGHLISGHVDCKGKFLISEKQFDFYNMKFEIPDTHCKYVVNKGSIAVNGISLTVAKIDGNIFKAAIIPHTFENTTLSTLKAGDYVNIETDILAKYVEKLTSLKEDNDIITLEYLDWNGYK